jgi:DNA-binding transcriptional LysR family regulator
MWMAGYGDAMRPFSEDQRSFVRTPLDDERILSGPFWGELRVFLAVAKARSFNRAAELLNTSQPTVSRQVRRLQDLLGSQLFIANQHGVQLTRKGDELAQALANLDHALFSISNDLRAELNSAEGVVRVSITDGLNIFFVAPALRAFSAQHPRLQVHLRSPANLISLRENQTDLMIGFAPAEGSDVTTRPLGCLHFIPVASSEYVQRQGMPTGGNLEQHYFLQSECYSAATGLWDGWNRAVSRGRVAHYCDNSFAYGMLVKAGMGIGLLGTYTVLEPAAVPLEIGVRVSVPLYALAMSERLKARPVSLAFDWLCEVFGTGNPWFAKELRLDNLPSDADRGFKMLFNL